MISPELQEKFRAEYNPDGSMLRRQQLRMLEILLHIDKICKEHNIPYWLSSGTLLGAVRHGGYIPWDDDLDIEMLREDYLRFEKIFKEDDDYVLQTYKNDLCYMQPYAKVRDKHTVLIEHESGEEYKYQGCFVDIFPMEYTHKFMNFLTYVPIWYLTKYVTKCRHSKLGRGLIKVLKTCHFGLMHIIRALMKLVPGKKLRHTYGAWCYKVERYNEELYPLTRVEFEGYEFLAPGNIDAYLRRLYGNYMQIPDVKETHVKTIEFLE